MLELRELLVLLAEVADDGGGEYCCGGDCEYEFGDDGQSGRCGVRTTCWGSGLIGLVGKMNLHEELQWSLAGLMMTLERAKRC